MTQEVEFTVYMLEWPYECLGDNQRMKFDYCESDIGEWDSFEEAFESVQEWIRTGEGFSEHCELRIECCVWKNDELISQRDCVFLEINR